PAVRSVQLHHRPDFAGGRRPGPQMDAPGRRQHFTLPQGRLLPSGDKENVMTDIEVEVAEELSAPVTIGVEAYLSEDYARAERDKLWRKVWQQVGRVEDLQLPDLRHPRRLRDCGAHRTRHAQGPPQRVRAPRPATGRHA